MLIAISKQDAHTAEILGRDTTKICEMQGFPPRLENDKQSRVDANIAGFKAEFAVARLLNVDPPTFNVLSDGGIDLWFYDYPIDVKLSGKEYGPLIFDSMDKFQAMIAVLVGATKDPNVMRVNGWVNKGHFADRAVEHDYGYGMRLKMEADEMFPMEVLWRRMSEHRFKPTEEA